MAQAHNNEDDERRPKISRMGQVAELRVRAEHYAEMIRGCPYKVGELVTPRAGLGVTNEGEPHLVVAVRENPDYEFITSYKPGASGQGQYHDMRILCYVGDMIVPFWCESWMYEHFSEEE